MARGLNRPGQGLVEYVLIIAVVAITLVAALTLFRSAIASELVQPAEEAMECVTPGQGGTAPGHGGTAPGQCEKTG